MEYKFSRLDVTNPDSRQLLAGYETLVPENLLPCLHDKDSFGNVSTQMIVIGATLDEQPVGIAIASCEQAVHHLVDICHIQVDLNHRNKHVGRQLLATLQGECQKEHGEIFSLVFDKDDPSAPAIEKILIANQWQGIRPFLIRCIFDKKFNPSWLRKNYELPPGYEEFFWKDLKEEERIELKRLVAAGAIPHAISPFNLEDKIEFSNSLGLRHDGNVVGWVITHRMTPDMIRYSAVYIDPELQFRNLSMKLIADSAVIHVDGPITYGMTELPILRVHSSWVHFTERRLVPHAIKVVRLMQAWAVFKSKPAKKTVK